MLAALLCAANLHGEVVDSSPGGFTVRVTTQIAAAPAAVYRQILHPAEWWNPQHTWSGDAHNLSIEAKAGGCFCETLPKGGGVRHMQVVHLAPGKILIMSGALGPLQTLAAAGTMIFQVVEEAGGTKLTVTYAVAGYLPTW